MNNKCGLAVAALVLAGTILQQRRTLLLLIEMLLTWLHTITPPHLFFFLPAAVLPAGIVAARHLMSRRRAVYLVDYACFRPSPTYRVPTSTFIEHANLVSFLDDGSVRFMTRMLERSGIGDESSLPPADHYIPPYSSFGEALAEAELVVFSAVDDLFAKTRISPSVRGGHGPDAGGRPGVDARVWVRVQVQQRGVGVPASGERAGQSVGRVHPSLPGEHPRSVRASRRIIACRACTTQNSLLKLYG
ncbi:hypothetical protein SEVIR_1G121866v4 [Setaria viridis]|uniref:FAE domain-containing protein n=1 Tax=Setaria viridis TaxID=4556 RepID=A0A4U6WC30_SETVI|nr:hypothetical protein SEVIR_1G121866v2 [Setaria viridis]